MIEVVDRPDAARYEILVDGGIAGFVQYRLRPDVIAFTHAEIREEFEGQGLGSKLVREALDGARDAGLSVAPLCPFVLRFVQRHPEYQDLVADQYRDLVKSGPAE
ncbi:GNAT family N-acetyltransferase [Microbispora sp. NPDC049125]|uniref:GNAT family N-acetyltransferase n=1 Tax=Microbispora sp. NPDC049125 TaxID=3154929 RepID=UPI003467B2E4